MHVLLKIVENYKSNVQIDFIYCDLLRSGLFDFACFGLFQFLTLACKHI